jgi:oligopeptidase A
MNPLVTGAPGDAGLGPHVGTIVANFTPPEDGHQPRLTHGEVTTLFHEFGHLLHHLLSDVEIPARGSMSVAWDFVELPSQILENWAWEREGLDLFARHGDTGEPIPAELFERLRRSRTFLEGVAQMRQLSFGTVDLALHIDFDPASNEDPIAFGQRVMEPFGVRPDFARNQFLTAFSHVFAGGYAAGYYSYKWSEVLDADAFGRFRRDGIFNPDTGRAFVDTILSKGDSDDPDALFRAFMGRGPDLGALLERNLGPEPEPVAGDD